LLDSLLQEINMKSLFAVAICLAASVTCEPTKLGDIQTKAHAAGGEVWMVDENTIMLKNFNYDGQGPDAFFWVGTEGTPSSTNEDKTKILAQPDDSVNFYEYRDDAAPVLRAYNNEEVTLTLPPGLKAQDLQWFSVWCRLYRVDFGSVVFEKPKDALPHPLAPVDDNSVSEPEPEAESEPEPEAEAEAESEPEPYGGSSGALTTSLATVAAFILACLAM